jgi:iron complex outermembrane receptor protein
LRQRLQLDPGSASLGGVAALGNDAQHRGSVSSSFELGPALELDIAVRRVGALPAPAVPAYTAIDARLGWHVRPGVELSFTGRNLGDARHPEWGPAANRAEIERSWFVNVVWRLK